MLVVAKDNLTIVLQKGSDLKNRTNAPETHFKEEKRLDGRFSQGDNIFFYSYRNEVTGLVAAALTAW